jgi:IS30 family transposase
VRAGHPEVLTGRAAVDGEHGRRPVPKGRSASGAEQAMRQAITTLPEQLRRSITWDQGKEMAYHAPPTQDLALRGH